MSARPARHDVPVASSPGSRFALLACALLIALFGVLAAFASVTKSATIDEPLHAVGGYLATFAGDFRVNPEDPPLWKYWAMLPQSSSSLRPDFNDPQYAAALITPDATQRFVITTLYRTRGVDGIGFIERSRRMMILLGVALAILLARWAWQWGGPFAAMSAAALISLDPNFLAHAPLIKNDVAIALAMFTMLFALQRVGSRATGLNVALAAAACAAGTVTKFSGVLLPPMLGLLLLIRALLPAPWPVFTWMITTPIVKLVAAVAIVVFTAAVTWGAIWASYGLRFAPTTMTAASFDFQPLAERSVTDYFRTGRAIATAPPHSQSTQSFSPPPTLQWSNPRYPLFTRAVLHANDRRLLPQAWLYGLLFTRESARARPAYLLGRRSDTGWWYYFPLAMLFKTPIATLLTFAFALAIALFAFHTRAARSRADPWPILCVAIPILLYGAFALASNLNLGIRHLLPIYPLLFLAAAVLIARFTAVAPRTTRAIAAVLGTALLLESLLAFPDYIPFFNATVGGTRNGINLLGDSNLDWGQDLPLLADWQSHHPDSRLYLCCFGSADPAAYGIRYINLPNGYFLNDTASFPSAPGVIAVSATKLQSLYLSPDARSFYANLRARQPREILGGSIYLYDFP